MKKNGIPWHLELSANKASTKEPNDEPVRQAMRGKLEGLEEIPPEEKIVGFRVS